MLITPRCEKCGTNLEKRTVQMGDGSAQRLVCSLCNSTYQPDQVCQVCRTARGNTHLNTTVYRSSILGNHQINHCPECRPPSKFRLEFETSPVTAFIKYGLAAACLLTTVLLIMAALFSGGNH